MEASLKVYIYTHSLLFSLLLLNICTSKKQVAKEPPPADDNKPVLPGLTPPEQLTRAQKKNLKKKLKRQQKGPVSNGTSEEDDEDDDEGEEGGDEYVTQKIFEERYQLEKQQFEEERARAQQLAPTSNSFQKGFSNHSRT